MIANRLSGMSGEDLMMNELLKITINERLDGLMIKEVLFDHYHFSRKTMSKVKNHHGIFLNNEHTYATNRVKTGDILQIYVPVENSEEIIPQPIPIDIIYEDDDLVVINKQPHIVVHPTRSHYLNTIANGLIYYWQQQGKSFRFRPVNRLDKDTSGLFIVAKSQYAHHQLSIQISENELKRTYHALVHGKIKQENGKIEKAIVKSPDHPLKRLVVPKEVDNAKQATTFFKIIEAFQQYTLVELRLITGRTHQIRVHMSSIGHPLVADELYGGSIVDGLFRQALHATKLEFYHPITKAPLSFSSPYPEDIDDFLQQMRKNMA